MRHLRRTIESPTSPWRTSDRHLDQDHRGRCAALRRQACSLRKARSPRFRSEQPGRRPGRLRNGPQDRRLDQNRRSRCAAHRRLDATMPDHSSHRDLYQTIESPAETWSDPISLEILWSDASGASAWIFRRPANQAPWCARYVPFAGSASSNRFVANRSRWSCGSASWRRLRRGLN